MRNDLFQIWLRIRQKGSDPTGSGSNSGSGSTTLNDSVQSSSLSQGHVGRSSGPSWLHPLSILLLNTYSIISPLLYAYRSKRVQRDFRKVNKLYMKFIFACSLYFFRKSSHESMDFLICSKTEYRKEVIFCGNVSAFNNKFRTCC
jgi:hypothetical protein